MIFFNQIFSLSSIDSIIGLYFNELLFPGMKSRTSYVYLTV